MWLLHPDQNEGGALAFGHLHGQCLGRAAPPGATAPRGRLLGRAPLPRADSLVVMESTGRSCLQNSWFGSCHGPQDNCSLLFG